VKTGISIVEINDELILGCKRFENKDIFVGPWSLELGLLKVVVSVSLLIATLYVNPSPILLYTYTTTSVL
jgi:hypothetical protein